MDGDPRGRLKQTPLDYRAGSAACQIDSGRHCHIADLPASGQTKEAQMKAHQRGLEPSPYANDDSELIGRDPRKLSAADWHQIRLYFPVGLEAIRAKCLDCAHTPSEVRKCVSVGCPLWPFRMGSVPKGYRQAMSAGGSDAD